MNAVSRDLPQIFEPNAENARALRDAFGKFATGVAVVTCDSDQGPLAITVNSFSSISMEPALVMWAAGVSSRRYPAFAAAEHYAVHILGADQKHLCDAFVKDGFALNTLPHDLNAQKVPLLQGCLARFECRKWSVQDAGDHAILLGEVLRVSALSGDALTFFGGKFAQIAQA